MYQSLLNEILFSHGNTMSRNEFANKIFSFTNNLKYGNCHDDDHVLILDDNVTGANIFVIHDESGDILINLDPWFHFLEKRNIQSYLTISDKFYIGHNINKNCYNCRSSHDLYRIDSEVDLCEKCIGDIRMSGTYGIGCQLYFFRDILYDLDTDTDTASCKIYYTINTSSLNIFCRLGSCYFRFIISYSEPLSTVNLYATKAMCKLCNTCFLPDCIQCYNILHYRNDLLKEFMIPKITLVYYHDNLLIDIKRYIFSLLVKVTF